MLVFTKCFQYTGVCVEDDRRLYCLLVYDVKHSFILYLKCSLHVIIYLFTYGLLFRNFLIGEKRVEIRLFADDVDHTEVGCACNYL